MIAYTVTATFADAGVADEWIAWLRGEHLAEVCAAGALDAEVIRLDGTPLRCEVRYHFASRAAFAAYERDHAPRLRSAGLQRFPAERGVQYQRSVGESVSAHRHARQS
jgi:hypothetical protein